VNQLPSLMSPERSTAGGGKDVGHVRLDRAQRVLGWLSSFITATALAAAPCASEPYIAELGNDPTTEWIGVASLNEGANGTLAGELCLVRREYIDHPALQRAIVHVPVHGAFADGKLRLSFQPVAEGPNFSPNEVTLERFVAWSNRDEAFEWWDFGGGENFWTDEGTPIRSAITQYLRLRRGPNLRGEVFSLSGPGQTQVAVYANAKAQEAEDSTLYSLDVYDGLSPSEAIKFEKGKIFQELFNVGLVNIFADTSKFGALKETLDRLGHGARILNAELAACPPTPMLTTVSVPPGLEFWYARRLQASGLVVAAYPEILARDPSYSEAFPFASAAIAAALRNPQLDTSGKYKAIWQNLEQSLKRFAHARRPGYLSSGSVAPFGTAPEFMFRAELSGKALAVCDSDRWEKIIVNATANSFDKQRGQAELSVNFSDGFVAKGKQPPGETRWRDNRIPDSDLGKLQELFTAFLRGNRTTTTRCLK
jgi:hypothetical protein